MPHMQHSRDLSTETRNIQVNIMGRQITIQQFSLPKPYFFLATKKREGVNISFMPPSTKSSAVALSNELTRVDPLGAILKNSRVDTKVWVQILPRRVMRKPLTVNEPFKVEYQGISRPE
mmetsp:Transcript_8597/g.14934  ORF Transcript_8597/g.14934 Transcript_8597/m.14934 type:complete len:119 (-) Transcript_8597:1035-1391(-)